MLFRSNRFACFFIMTSHSFPNGLCCNTSACRHAASSDACIPPVSRTGRPPQTKEEEHFIPAFRLPCYHGKAKEGVPLLTACCSVIDFFPRSLDLPERGRLKQVFCGIRWGRARSFFGTRVRSGWGWKNRRVRPPRR